MNFTLALLAAIMMAVTAGLNSALAAPSRRAAIAGMASVLLPVAPRAARAGKLFSPARQRFTHHH